MTHASLRSWRSAGAVICIHETRAEKRQVDLSALEMVLALL